MPFDTGEIAKLKASVPGRFRGVGDAGTLSRDFSGNVLGTLPPPLGSDLDRYNLEIAAAGAPPGAGPNFILSNSGLLMRQAVLEKSEQAKGEREDIDVALAQSREHLRQMLADLDAQIEAIDLRLDEIRQRRIAIGEAMDATQDIEDLISENKFDPNNPAHVALMRKAGIDPEDMADRDTWLDVIRHRRDDLNREDGDLASEADTLRERRGVVVIRRKAVNNALADIDNADTDEAKLLAIRRAETVAGVRALGGAALETEDAGTKMIAAEAVGVSAESEQYNRLATTQTDTFYSDQNDMDWGAPKGVPVVKP